MQVFVEFVHTDNAPLTVTVTCGKLHSFLVTYGEIGDMTKVFELADLLETSMVFPELRLLPAVEIVSLVPGQPVHEMMKRLLNSEF